MIHGLVSTIIPVYNQPTLLPEAVTSALAQSYDQIEIIIVDDGSTDATAQVARELASKYDWIHVIRQENGGPGKARQAGLDASRGEFVQFLDSDDLLLPQKFERQVAALSSDPACGVAYGKSREYNMGTSPADVPTRRTGERICTILPAALQSRWWTTSTPLYRRAVLNRVGPWTNLKNEEDWEYDCRIGVLHTRLAYCDVFVSDKRYHEGEHLSHGGSSDPSKLRDRAKAHQLIYGHACRAGITDDAPEMQHFARELFLLARQCGNAGLGDEAQMLFNLSREASGPQRGSELDFQLYSAVASLVGWTMAGHIACQIDKLRNQIATLKGS